MDCIPLNSPQRKGQTALHLAQGTKQIKMSWTLKFLNCAWSMSYISLSLLSLSIFIPISILFLLFFATTLCVGTFGRAWIQKRRANMPILIRCGLISTQKRMINQMSLDG